MVKQYATETNSTPPGVGDGTTTTDKTVINGGAAVPEVSPAGPSGLNHNMCRSVYWTPDEQSKMNKLITKRASPNLVKRYAKIVLKLKEKKTLNDVALRYRWMTEKRNGKQRKDGPANKSINKEKAANQQVKSSSYATSHSNGQHHAQLSTSMDGDECIDDEISYEANVGAASQLLERNDQAMNHVSANGSALKEKAAYQQVKPTSHATNHSNGLYHAQLSTSLDSDDEISYKAIGGSAGQLLEQNEQAMNHISANLSAFKVHRNKNLIYQMINNIDELVNLSLSDMPEMEKSALQRYNFSIIRRLKIG